jgi:hypothetical protein
MSWKRTVYRMLSQGASDIHSIQDRLNNVLSLTAVDALCRELVRDKRVERLGDKYQLVGKQPVARVVQQQILLQCKIQLLERLKSHVTINERRLLASVIKDLTTV